MIFLILTAIKLLIRFLKKRITFYWTKHEHEENSRVPKTA